jgi:hypothetical protein
VTESLSIVIPLYDPTFDQEQRVMRMVDSIMSQSLTPDEVVMACSHQIPYLGKIERRIQSETKFKFVLNSSTSAPENLNLAIKASSSSLVKILFQDDFLIGVNHLGRLVRALNTSRSQWGVSSSSNFFEELYPFRYRMLQRWRSLETALRLPQVAPGVVPGGKGFLRKAPTPKFSESLSIGINQIGMPSAVIFRKAATIAFDDRLKYLFDCEWYLSMKHKFGKPLIIPRTRVGIAIHSGQATHWAKSLLEPEMALVKQKHYRAFTGFLKTRACICERDSYSQVIPKS